MSTQFSENKIIIPIEIAFKTPTEQGQDPQFQQSLQESINDAVNEAVGEIGEDDYKKFAAKGFGIKGEELNTLLSFAKNPLALALTLIPYLGVIFATEAGAKILIEALRQPGFFLDPRFKRILEKEIDNMLDRKTQASTQIGSRQVIISSVAGFRNFNGAGESNTYRDIRRIGGLNRFVELPTIRDKALGTYWKGS